MKYQSVLPFLDREDLNEVVDKVISGEIKNIKFTSLFPFLNDETLNKVIDFLIQEKRTKELQRALPFMSKSKINELYEAVESGEIEGIKATSFLPFLSKTKLKEIFETLIKNTQENEDDEHDEHDEDFDDEDE